MVQNRGSKDHQGNFFCCQYKIKLKYFSTVHFIFLGLETFCVIQQNINMKTHDTDTKELFQQEVIFKEEAPSQLLFQDFYAPYHHQARKLLTS